MQNILTIDIEDYFQVENFKEYIDYSDWDDYECRVVANTELILDLLADYEVTATFFVLGWVAERYPKLVNKIAQAGHEVASHGFNHQMIYKQSPDEFKTDLSNSIELLEELGGQKVLGYRAPSFSVVEDSLWALDIMQKLGLEYDASIFPIQGHDRYGVQEADPAIHQRSGLYEVPPGTVEFFGKRWPAAGGGYFRLFPYWLTKYFIHRINQKENRPAVVYLHPWEFDPDQPRIEAADRLSKFRHYVNLHKTEQKLKRLLSDFEFTSIRNYLDLKAGDNND